MSRLVPKMMAFFAKKYGENHVIKMNELQEVYKKLPDTTKDEMEPFYVLWGNTDYRIKRGYTVITTATNPATAVKALKEAPKQEEDVSKLSASELAVKVLRNIPVKNLKQKTKVPLKKSTKDVYEPVYAQTGNYDHDMFDTSDDDIQDILRSF